MEAPSGVLMAVLEISHGTITAYTTDKCRCDVCREAWVRYQTEWRAARLADPNVDHGKRVTYLCGCRCSECRAANAAYNLARKARLNPDATPHGTLDGYGSYGCRCDRCTEAKRRDTRDYYLRHQLEAFEKVNRRLALIARDKRQVTSRDVARLFHRHGGCCAYCGQRSRHLEVDHVVPLSRGGRHAIGNMLPACRRCNRSKSNRLLVEWRAR